MSKFSFLPRAAKTRRALRDLRKVKPNLEALEDRFLPSCATISGFVYQDANGNGLMDLGEPPIADVVVELHNDQGAIVASTTTDANGFYQFDHDGTINQTAAAVTQNVEFPSTATDYTLTGEINRFDESLGQLQAVEIIHEGSITSEIKVENTSPISTSTIQGTVGGTIKLIAPGATSTLNLSQNAGSYGAGIYDGTKDYAGTSGTSFGAHTANGEESITLTGADVNPYIGSGKITLTENAQAASNAAGGGNLDVSLTSSGRSKVTVVYHYIPGNCLRDGDYTIVETQPPDFVDGMESKGGVVLSNPPGTDSIAVTLARADLAENNFGEDVKPATVSGHVYADSNDDGVLDSGEAGIAGVAIKLTGFDDRGPIAQDATTDNDGYYEFTDLRPGTYALIETQPAGYNDGTDTIGSQGGTTANDAFSSIVLVAGMAGIDNNFGEIVPEVADLGIVKTAGAATVIVGDTLSYSLTVTNSGTHTARGVEVTDVLPPGVSLVNAAGSGWTITNMPGGFKATRPELAVGATSVISATIKVPAVSRTITNRSSVTSRTPDNNPTNNQSQVTTPVTVPSVAPTAIPFGRLPIISKNQLFLDGGDYLAPALRGELAFIDGTYRTAMGRPATTAEAMAGVRQLQAGTSRATIVGSLWNSPEHLTILTNAIYRQFLQRNANSGEAATTAAALRNGTSEIDLSIGLLSSSEYLAAHPSPDLFVGGLFVDVLGRLPEAQSQQDLVLAMDTQTTAQLASDLLKSDDSLMRIVDSSFRAVLRRGATSTELQAWKPRLQSGQVNPGGLMQQLLSSSEFYQLAFASAV